MDGRLRDEHLEATLFHQDSKLKSILTMTAKKLVLFKKLIAQQSLYGRLLFPNLLPLKNKLGKEIQKSADSTLGAPCGPIRITNESPCPLHYVYLAENTSLHLVTGPFVPKLARFTQLRPPSAQRRQASPSSQRPELFIPRRIREEVVDCCRPDGGGATNAAPWQPG